jgi:uncharacterized protein (DUF4415 family)
MSDQEPKIIRYTRKPLTEEQRARIDALVDVPDDQIDFSDIPATTAEDWVGAERGKFYRALKHQVTLRLDGDVIEWFKREAAGERGYQTRINRALREYVAAHSKKAG